MMRCAVFLACALLSLAASADWRMFDRRVGLFVHWGIYSVNGWHEQEEMRRKVPRAEYERAAQRFTAAKFDATELVKAAESLGAEYIVITAKHHDGFCLWNTRTTDFSVMNTPCGRDVLKELSEACRARGMKLGLYYSNPDWHHPNAYNPKSTHQIEPSDPRDRPDLDAYRAYVRAQITELLTNYGEIVCLFWDIPPQVEDPTMNELVRRLQPGIKIDDRGWSKGDYSTPERGIPDGAAFATLTEACDSVGAQSWGYRANEDYRTVGYLTRSLDRILSMGGNYLLNVGPRADGTLPDESRDRLAQVGAWYAKTRESYRDVETVTNLVADANCFVTRRGDTAYLHYPKGLDATGVNLRPLARLPRRAVLLNTGAELDAELVDFPSDHRLGLGPTLHLRNLPADRLANESVVIRLEGVYDDYSKRTYRFPNVNGDKTVICREISTERDLLYVGGVFYEVPADNAGGFAELRPIALADEPVRTLEGRLGLLFVNGKPMAFDTLWKNGTAAAAYWLWEECGR